MVIITDSERTFHAVNELYNQANQLLPSSVKDCTAQQFYENVAGIGSKSLSDLRARVVREGPDTGKLTLDHLASGQWIEVPGIVRVEYVSPRDL